MTECENVLVFRPDEVPFGVRSPLPARLVGATFFIADESKSHRLAVPHRVDGRTIQGRAQSWIAEVIAGLAAPTRLSLTYDSTFLSPDDLIGGFDERPLARVSADLVKRGLTCLHSAAFERYDSETLHISEEHMPILDADGWLFDMVAGDGAMGHIAERWFCGNVAEILGRFGGTYMELSPAVLGGWQALAEVRAGAVHRVWDLRSFMSWKADDTKSGLGHVRYVFGDTFQRVLRGGCYQPGQRILVDRVDELAKGFGAKALVVTPGFDNEL